LGKLSGARNDFPDFPEAQGDPIGHRKMGDCILWAVFCITEVAQFLGLLFSTVKVMYSFFAASYTIPKLSQGSQG
jgi:hypothetical protein